MYSFVSGEFTPLEYHANISSESAKVDTLNKEWNTKVIIFIAFNLVVIAFYKFSVTDFNMINTSTIVYRDGVLKHQRINQDFKDLKHLKSWLNTVADEMQETSEKIPRDEYVTAKDIELTKQFEDEYYLNIHHEGKVMFQDEYMLNDFISFINDSSSIFYASTAMFEDDEEEYYC